MDEQEKKENKTRSLWQIEKEIFYDKIPVSVKQLDVIIGLALAALAVVFVLIVLDAAGIIG